MLAVILGLPLSALAQLSPGDLSQPHEGLEGISNCTSCHELGEGPSADKCLECHQLTKRELDQKQGYHHQLVNVQGKSCFGCHNEHAGRDFELIHWETSESQFDHSVTGYVLEGRHATLPCRDCHNPALIKTDLTGIEKDKDLTRTFMGLATNCLDCHRDEHRGQLGNNCQTCHNPEKFKPAAGFSHDKARFLLTGKHAVVDCAKCHKQVEDGSIAVSPQVTYAHYKPINFANCTDCHKDVHRGKFGADCNRCHNNSNWKQVAANQFNHDSTTFPLIGLHQKVPCEKCHKGGALTGRLAHGQCLDCHTDIHREQFVKREDKGACNGCHNEQGFMPAIFKTADHDKTEFKLVGSHLAQPCVACHKRAVSNDGTEYRNFRMEHSSCLSCHQDRHAGQFTGSDPVKNCTTCHNESNWHELNFNHDIDSRYRLAGAHQKVACIGCHKTEPIGDLATIRYRPLAQQCKDCHQSAKELREL